MAGYKIQEIGKGMLTWAVDAVPHAMGWADAEAFAGNAAVIISGALLLAGVDPVVPMMGLVAGVAVMLGASSTGSNSVSKLSKRRLGWPSP